MAEHRIGDPYSRGIEILNDGVNEARDEIRRSTERSQRLMRDLVSEAEVRTRFKASGLKALEALEKLGQIDEEKRNAAIEDLHAVRADGSVLVDGQIDRFVHVSEPGSVEEVLRQPQTRGVVRGGI